MTITIMHMTMIDPGDSSILDLNSSKYRVRPPCPEGSLILLSLAMFSLKF